MLFDKSTHKPPFYKDAQMRKGEFWQKMLLQSSVSVEKVSCAQLGDGQGGVHHGPDKDLEFWRCLLGPG